MERNLTITIRHDWKMALRDAGAVAAELELVLIEVIAGQDVPVHADGARGRAGADLIYGVRGQGVRGPGESRSQQEPSAYQ